MTVFETKQGCGVGICENGTNVEFVDGEICGARITGIYHRKKGER